MLSEKRRERNRSNLGARLKDARLKKGYTQKALAKALGVENHTMISQMELGYMAVPSNLWVPLAETLNMDRYIWVLLCTQEYHPDMHRSLFGNLSRREIANFLDALHSGQLNDLLKQQN
ncbi:helix-turn-helix domain-containing protein [Ruegeria arenilitoris]|uniref:helix-turn-helix domain-containing protein n=1 Tax=Ruegeria arenilitoris TaxID=1173585 RepID=UPI00147A0B74|nr:helix-turn-helix transcriptional regulator [Ruegeria arenilitoris]